ncbi:hypothetical protein [Myxococcus llanfairpwllgwyngyllgogerychwyrndrobwllllantysiliogogogochensis]|nr:hypothetical protein [Myxococcus llanfairpwllgwyngyllgogerychwyrndrobwllllantysiliogogogochensis]
MLNMMRVLLLVMCAVGVTACATTTSRAEWAPPSCEPGAVLPCAEWGAKLLREGDRPRAIEAYGKACEEGDLSSCMTEGKLRKESGDLSGAERPLTKVYETGDVAAALALAEVHEAKGQAVDQQAAARLRHQAPAMDKPATEVLFAMRTGSEMGTGLELSFNLQPMAFMDRRLGFGANMVFGGEDGLVETNGFAAYQHYVSPYVVPYARAMVGGMTSGQDTLLNLGGETGVKLCLEDIGHLNVAAGVSRASGGYFSVGLGLNGIIVLAILLQYR